MLPHELIFHETEPYLTLETGLDDEEPQQDSKDSTQVNQMTLRPSFNDT